MTVGPSTSSTAARFDSTAAARALVAAQAFIAFAYVLTVLVPYGIGVLQHGSHEALLHDPSGPHDPKDIHQLMVGGAFVLSLPLSVLGSLLFAGIIPTSGFTVCLAGLSGVLLASRRWGAISRRLRWALAVAIVTSLLLVGLWTSDFGAALSLWMLD